MATTLSTYRPFRFTKLAAPITVTEAAGEVQILTLTETLPAGAYAISVSMVAAFTSANDQLSWRVDGSSPSPSFLLEAKDSDENLPFAYAFPFLHTGGDLTMTILAQITGVGAADVDIVASNITFERKGE